MIRVFIGVPRAHESGRTKFYDYYHSLQLPVGTTTSFVDGQSIAYNRNVLVKQALDNGCSHIFFLDDDTQFAPDILIKLICHNVDMVTGLMLMRDYPHKPLIFDMFDKNGAARHIFLNGQQSKELVPIVASGLGCCLLKLKVFSKLEEPFFRLGEIRADEIGEDFGFFRRVHALGIQHYCDMSVRVGHQTRVNVWPEFDNGWKTQYHNNNGIVAFPAVEKPADGS